MSTIAKLPAWWKQFIQNVCELDGRDSPEDEPDAMVATERELQNAALRAIECELEAAPAADAAKVEGLPPHDPTKTNAKQGLYAKFRVTRTDGSDAPGGRHHGCDYFVLDVTHDKHAKAALTAYAAAVSATHSQLAADMRTRWGLVSEPAADAVPVVATVYRNGTGVFGRATLLERWEDGAMSLPVGSHRLVTEARHLSAVAALQAQIAELQAQAQHAEDVVEAAKHRIAELQARQVPEGFVAVPGAITTEMYSAVLAEALYQFEHEITVDAAIHLCRAMIAAAPSNPATQPPVYMADTRITAQTLRQERGRDEAQHG